MGVAADTTPNQPEEHSPEYLEHSVWPVLVALATGVAITGLFFLLNTNKRGGVLIGDGVGPGEAR